jgi:hypothetical protein
MKFTTTPRTAARRDGKDTARSAGVERFRVLWLSEGKEHKSAWFYSRERAHQAREAMADKYGRAIVFAD